MGQADFIRAPVKNATNAASTAKFTATTDSAVSIIPQEWIGAYVRITPVGGNLHFLFTDDSTATVDRTVTATAAGDTGATVGGYLADGDSWYVIVPDIAGKPVYFAREADATVVVYITRS